MNTVNRTSALAILTGGLIGIVFVLIFGTATNWYGLALPRFQADVQYEFSYTMKSTVPGQDADGKEIAVATRQFVVDQTTMFPAAEIGLVEDISLPPNTFVFRRKMQPALAVGGNIVRGAYEFVEVRYHQATQERVPYLKRPPR